MKLKNLFLLVILFLFFDNNMQASGHMVGKEFRDATGIIF